MSEVISRQDVRLIESDSNAYPEEWNEDYEKGFVDAINRVLDLPSVQLWIPPRRCIDCENFNKTQLLVQKAQQKWIPCSERLPDDGTYLCWEWQGFCYVDSFKNGKWETAEKCYTKCLAWMPLPEPYKEGENG